MCKFASGIIGYKHKKVYFDIDIDSHSELMEKLKIKDETEWPSFVKFEITPKDGDVFNHEKSNWEYKVDSDHSQDRLPDWYDEKKAKEQAWEKVQEVFKARFLVNKKIQEIKEGRWYLKNSNVEKMLGTSKANLWGTSQVGEMRETSQVGVMRGTSQVGEMRGTSRVGEMWETSQVGVMWETSQVGVMRGTSRVGVMRGTSQVEKLNDQAFAIREFKIIVSDKKYQIEYANKA